MIPKKSEASIKNGHWFVHHDSNNIIQVWGSNFNGKEKVFLNGNLVSERRSVKVKSEHSFEDKAGQNYEVSLKVQHLVKGGMECIIRKDKKEIKVFKTRFEKGKRNLLRKWLIVLGASVLFGIAVAVFDLPDYALYIFVAAVLVVYFKTTDVGEIVIDED